jgi:hypothetical protein
MAHLFSAVRDLDAVYVPIGRSVRRRADRQTPVTRPMART